ncbi:hypothetical protein P7K49_024660 [Saguinus oedipus]|uniref:Uncharacterized protein n=1 Tax=Saguinus oedipus TaxID=9490 RepID=A0ABQ9UQ47_SAGOE|nr:hypothetical protein P7K49_024660 [Saguinus oedipus]
MQAAHLALLWKPRFLAWTKGRWEEIPAHLRGGHPYLCCCRQLSWLVGAAHCRCLEASPDLRIQPGYDSQSQQLAAPSMPGRTIWAAGLPHYLCISFTEASGHGAAGTGLAPSESQHRPMATTLCLESLQSTTPLDPEEGYISAQGHGQRLCQQWDGSQTQAPEKPVGLQFLRQ